MPHSLLALGANLGDRAATLQAASDLLAVTEGVRLLRTSQWHEMAPVGGPGGQRAFLNAAALIETALSPTQLFAKLVNIEQRLGRKRETHWGPRSIDIDLLIHGQQIVEQSDLVVPHARMVFRRFVLEPAVEIAPEMRHPTTGWTVRRLWENVQRDLDYIAILGPSIAGCSSLAQQVAEQVAKRSVVPSFATDRELRKPGHDFPWSLAAELNLIAQRSRLLKDAAMSKDSKRSEHAADGQMSNSCWLISDFWIDTSLVFTSLFSPSPGLGEEPARERIQTHLQSLRGVLPVPKLIVWLDPPEKASVLCGATESLRNEVFAARVAPFFRLDYTTAVPNSPPRWDTELLAALQAMR